jgi:hypothetical protein
VGSEMCIRDSNSSVPGYPGPFIYNGVIRSINISSLGPNLTGVQFTINGLGSSVDANGNPNQVIGPVSETIVGPNANANAIVTSVNIYSQITSITVNGNVPVDSFTIGFGPNGITDYCFFDYNRPYFQAYYQVTYSNYAALSTDIYQSLSRPQVIDPNAGNLINVGPSTPFKVNNASIATASGDLKPLPFTGTAWANISLTAADSAIITFLQQGIRS